MENRTVEGTVLGPRPASLARRVGPTPAQASVLAALEDRGGPVTLAVLIGDTGLHENTLREHLEGLLEQGLVRRARSSPSGRGRPAWRYEAVEEAALPRGAEYAGLAAALAAQLHHGSSAPRRDAESAGAAWGRELARGALAGDGADRVVALLDELGFGPRRRAGGTTVELTRCPLLHTARRFPDVVCGVHLGIVRGVLAEAGADPAGAALFPFDAPGSCRLELGPRPGAADS